MPISTPLVSICIPTFNGEDFIYEALLSVSSQSYSNIEIIVSDDHSTDRTLEIIKGLISDFKSPVHIYNHEPAGIGANWNNCVKKAKGKYIKFLFQDDKLDAHCVEKMVLLAESKDQLGLIFSRRTIIGVVKDMKFDISLFHDKYEAIMSGKRFLRNKHLYWNPKNKIGEPTSVMLRKSVFDKIGFFDERLKQSLDYEFWYRICKYYDLGYINEELAEFRMHQRQTSNVNTKLIVRDKLLLPLLFIKNLFWNVHFYTKYQLIKHVIYGFFRYYIFTRVN